LTEILSQEAIWLGTTLFPWQFRAKRVKEIVETVRYDYVVIKADKAID